MRGKRRIMKDYRQRNELLRRLNLGSYKTYLKSNLWASIRRTKLAKNLNCHACGAPATQVHHGKYTALNLLGHADDHLFSVCAPCHFAAEFSESGRKQNVHRATKILKAQRRDRWFAARRLAADLIFDSRTPPSNLDSELRERLERED